MQEQCSFRIEVSTKFVDEQSDPDSDRYVFAYTITIANTGTIAAQLISRRWVITDGNGKVEEVSGEGVVGEQPLLNPGERFRYTSGAILQSPVGSMQGSYRMQAENGIDFDAPIPAFTLAVPGTLN